MVAAPGNSPLDFGVHDPSRASPHTVKHTSRIVTVLQALGSLVGIPVGLVSAYSIYHGNFTAEAQCQTLRANIVAMLDKNADPTTLRMLVGRDVVTFESQCAAVDPDAVKAFKSLLTAKSAPASAAPKQAAKEPPQKSEPAAKPAEPVKQVAAPPAPPVKPAQVKAAPVKTVPPVETAKPSAAAVRSKPAAEAVKPAPSVEAKAGEPDAAASDANWIASVRQALTHAPARQEPASASAAVAVPAPPPATLAAPPVSQPRVVPEAPPRPATVPALPEPVSVAAPPAPPPSDDHPVPPGSIPEAQPMQQAAAPAERSWMSKVPILNRVVGN